MCGGGGASAATCTAVATVQLIQPYTQYEERPTLVDLRVAKTVTVGRAKFQPRVDVYNVFNKSTVLGEVGTFGPAWKYPYDLYGGRLFKIGAQIDF